MGSFRLIIHDRKHALAALTAAFAAFAGGHAAAQSSPITSTSGLVYQSLRDGNGALRGQVLDVTGGWKLCGVAGIANTVTGALFWQTPDAQTAGWLVNADGTAHTICRWGRTAGWQLRAVGR